MPFFVKFGIMNKPMFSKKFSIPRRKNPFKPMENSVDNVENLVFSRVVSPIFYFCLWKTFEKTLSSLF